jgi:hypothetical protein
VKMEVKRSSVVAFLLAAVLLGVFISVNYWLDYKDSQQVIDPLAAAETEHLPASLAGKGKTLAFHDFESVDIRDTSQHLAPSGYRGRQSLKMNANVPFSPGLWMKFKDIDPGRPCWIRVTGFVWFSCLPSEVKCSLVATCNHNGVNYKYMFVPLELKSLKQNQWNGVSIDYAIPEAPDREDVLQAYFWYRGNGEMLVDEIVVEFFRE